LNRHGAILAAASLLRGTTLSKQRPDEAGMAGAQAWLPPRWFITTFCRVYRRVVALEPRERNG